MRECLSLNEIEAIIPKTLCLQVKTITQSEWSLDSEISSMQLLETWMGKSGSWNIGD